MAVSIHRISREYIWWKVDSNKDLSSSTVEVACISDPAAYPLEEDWVTARLVSPDDPEFGDGLNWWVQLLVGPGIESDMDLSSAQTGDMQTWIRVTDSPERPVRRPGVITLM